MYEAMGSYYFEVSNSLVSGVSGALTYHTWLRGALMPKPPYKSFTKWSLTDHVAAFQNLDSVYSIIHHFWVVSPFSNRANSHSHFLGMCIGRLTDLCNVCHCTFNKLVKAVRRHHRWDQTWANSIASRKSVPKPIQKTFKFYLWWSQH